MQVSWEDMIEAMANDFESPLFRFYPILEFMKEKLRALGAQAALLSGSGATVFGLFLPHVRLLRKRQLSYGAILNGVSLMSQWGLPRCRMIQFFMKPHLRPCPA